MSDEILSKLFRTYMRHFAYGGIMAVISVVRVYYYWRATSRTTGDSIERRCVFSHKGWLLVDMEWRCCACEYVCVSHCWWCA
jgi:hypothetical protein